MKDSPALWQHLLTFLAPFRPSCGATVKAQTSSEGRMPGSCQGLSHQAVSAFWVEMAWGRTSRGPESLTERFGGGGQEQQAAGQEEAEACGWQRRE